MIAEGISLVFPVMNRTNILVQSVPTWLESDAFNELIIVDWSSSEPIFTDPSTQDIINDPRVKVIRVENEPFFLSPSHSINLGVSRASNNIILKLDIDYKLINFDLFKFIKNISPILKRSFFVTDFGFCKVTISMMGFVLFNKDHFLAVNGYNENLRGWGYEDIDFYNRLSEITQKNIISDLESYVFHIPHDDSLRIANHIDKETPIVDNERMNRARAKALPWTKPSSYNTVKTIYDSDNKVKCEFVERIK
jgi:predicted glycosyltransferase involved in capsule biosynthesis